MDNNNRQRAYLEAMGIDVWVPVTTADALPDEQPHDAAAEPAVPPPQLASPDNPASLKETLSAINQEKMPGNSAEVKEIPVIPQPVKGTPDCSEMDWRMLQASVVSCEVCDFAATRTQTVFGTGNQHAELMIIGEAPGAEEDKQGEPFVGAAGKLLNSMLLAMGYSREQVYIANVLKCRPPNNRDPSPEEAANCWTYLRRQIELVQPKLILALGRIAAQRLLKTNTSLARLRGQFHHLEDIDVPVLVTYHPAYLLRSPKEKRKAWEDLQDVMKHLHTSREADS